MERKIYQLTQNDLRKAYITTEDEYNQELSAFDSEKEALGKRFALKKRDYAVRLLRRTREYYAGKGQGALDLAHGLKYSASKDKSQAFDNAFNLGYYTGYTDKWALNDLIKHNENFSHLQEK